MKGNPLVTPILKWAGGKRQLLPLIRKEFPHTYSTYYEPFVGGGAVLFDIQPARAVVNDVNEELINLYQVVQDQVEELIADLNKHKNEMDYFYQIRELDRDRAAYAKLSAVERASRILYLNKTCYNGLFRVNQQGEFNAPFGSYKNPKIVNGTVLRAVSDFFTRSQIIFRCGDFTEALEGIESGSFVYFDPPYDPISDSSSFTGYDKGGFHRSEQIRLKEMCDTLDSLGVKFLLSNSATRFILDLYQKYEVKIIQAKRTINSKADKRGNVDEVLIKNYSD